MPPYSMECSPFCNYGHTDPNEFCTTVPSGNGWGWKIILDKRNQICDTDFSDEGVQKQDPASS